MRRVCRGALLSSAALLLACSEAKPPAAPPAEAATQVSPVPPASQVADPRVAALERAVAQLQAEAAARRGATSSVLPAPIPAAPIAAASSPTPLSVLMQEDAARTAELHAAFRNEPANAAWASSAQATLRGAVQAAAPPGVSFAVECRSRTCRVSLTVPPSALGDWLPNLVLKLAPSFSDVARVDGDTPGSTTLYVRA